MPDIAAALGRLGTGPVLVTGASGFIGGRLAARLAAAGLTVVGTVRPGSRHSLPQGVQPVEIDLTDRDAVTGVIRTQRPHLVFHLAGRVTGDRSIGQAPGIMLENVSQVVYLATAVAEAGIGRLVLAGSMEEPGAGEAATAVPGSPYAAAKWAASGFARMAAELYGLPVTLARLFMVYGPGQRDRGKLVPHVIASLLRGEAPALSSGRREVDWVFVEDVVDALIVLGAAPELQAETIDIGSGQLVTIRTLVERIVAILGTTVAPRFGALPDRPLETVRTADVDRTRALTGWSPRVSLEEGLQRTVAALRAEPAARD